MDSGTLNFEMWQDVANVENRNGGRPDFGKEHTRQRLAYAFRSLEAMFQSDTASTK